MEVYVSKVDGFTCPSSATFDPRFKRFASARELFEQAKPYLGDGATLENVEFDLHCPDVVGTRNPHTANCRIEFISVRRSSDGPDGELVYGVRSGQFSYQMQQDIREAHNAAFVG